MSHFELSPNRRKILDTSGNLLILGGPGSGKTTIAILKAGRLVGDRKLFNQKILFLSFARAAVSRVVEAVKHSSLNEEAKRSMVFDTYHAFFWKIIKTHGYLLGLPRRLSVLSPAEQAVSLSEIRSDYRMEMRLSDKEKAEKARREKREQKRLAYEEGRVCFDLFADIAASLLNGSQKIRQLVSLAFPTVVLDEFQDTNDKQWDVVKELGENSCLIALADPEQRIYDFVGANPDRVKHYQEWAKPSEFDLSGDNYRSPETDIVKFGKDILEGKVRNAYKDIKILCYEPNKNQAFFSLKTQICHARSRLFRQQQNDWSLAVLVPTKKLMNQVSDELSESEPEIIHQVAVDIEGKELSAGILAFLLQPESSEEELLSLLSIFFRGKGGDKLTKTSIQEARKIEKAAERVAECKKTGKELSQNSIARPILEVFRKCRDLEFSGNPQKDWSTVRNILRDSDCSRLQEVAKQHRNISILDRGTKLQEALSHAWRETEAYTNALDIVRKFFDQEHFAMSRKPKTGIFVMNMHKAKGHQFDEVIIFEGWPKGESNPDRIVKSNRKENSLGARKNLHMSITRAKVLTTIMTPQNDPCILLPPKWIKLQALITK